MNFGSPTNGNTNFQNGNARHKTTESLLKGSQIPLSSNSKNRDRSGELVRSEGGLLRLIILLKICIRPQTISFQCE